MNTEDTVILLGDSPFIDEIKQKLCYVVQRFTTMGINRIVNTYKTNYQVFVDERMLPVANKHPDIYAVSLQRYGDMVRTKEKELYNSYSFNFDSNTEKDLCKNGKLAWCGFTHDFALSYLITKGWKNIILIGTTDFSIGAMHHSVQMAFTPSLKLVEKSKRFIGEVCTKRANIYTCNPNSLLTVERVSIEDLLT